MKRNCRCKTRVHTQLPYKQQEEKSLYNEIGWQYRRQRKELAAKKQQLEPQFLERFDALKQKLSRSRESRQKMHKRLRSQLNLQPGTSTVDNATSEQKTEEMQTDATVAENVTSYWKRDASYQMGRVAAAEKPSVVSKYIDSSFEASGHSGGSGATGDSLSQAFQESVTTPPSVESNLYSSVGMVAASVPSPTVQTPTEALRLALTEAAVENNNTTWQR